MANKNRKLEKEKKRKEIAAYCKQRLQIAEFSRCTQTLIYLGYFIVPVKHKNTGLSFSISI